MSLHAFDLGTPVRRKRIPNPIGFLDGRKVIEGDYLVAAELARDDETDRQSRGLPEMKEDQ